MIIDLTVLLDGANEAANLPNANPKPRLDRAREVPTTVSPISDRRFHSSRGRVAARGPPGIRVVELADLLQSLPIHPPQLRTLTFRNAAGAWTV